MNYFNDALELKDFTVVIQAHHAGVSLSGIIDQETINIPFGASLSGSLAAQAKEGFLRGTGKAIMNKLFGNLGKNAVDVVETMGSSIKTYQNGADLELSFSCSIFPGENGNPKDYKEIIHQLSKLTQPYVKKNILYSSLYDPKETSLFLKDYKVFDNELICIRIGDWFSKCGLFCTSASTELSTIRTEDNQPLYIKVNFRFVPYRMQTPDDVKKMFK